MSSVLNSKKSIDRSIAAEQLTQQLSALLFREGTLFLSKQISSSSSRRISASRTGLLARKGTARNLSWFRAERPTTDLISTGDEVSCVSFYQLNHLTA